MSFEDRVAKSFREAFELGKGEDLTGLKYRGHPNWSSIGHMTLIAALEDEFDVIVDADDIIEMSNYAKVVEMMKKYES